MKEYQYCHIVDQTNGIRLVTILPGGFSDNVRVQIYHSSLQNRPKKSLSRWTLLQLRESLPAGWRAFETLAGRFVFARESDWTYFSNHPDETIEKSCYEVPAETDSEYKPLFEALSYVWGNQEDGESIVVESSLDFGQHADIALHSTIKIGKNLAEALRHLRYLEHGRTLWVDALCIDQNNHIERNFQVKKMAHIYSSARHVIIWLGVEDKGSKNAISTLSYIGKQAEFTKEHQLIGAPEATEEDWHAGTVDLPYDESTYSPIAELLKRPWFSRLWIIQEAQLANSFAFVQCGSDRISWSVFRRAVHCLQAKRNAPGFSLPASIEFLLVPLTGIISLPLLCHRFAYQSCSDPRDRIYGLLGLAPPALRDAMEQDYSDSVGKVFRDSLLSCISYYKRMEFLSFCYLSPRNIQAPSWVPDLTVRRPVTSQLLNQFAAGFSAAQATFCPPNRLDVLGVLGRKVVFVTTPAPEAPEDCILHLRMCAAELKPRSKFSNEAEFLEEFAVAITADSLLERFPFSTRSPKLEQWKAMVEHYILKSMGQFPFDSSFFNDYCVRMIHGRPFIIMEDGSIGLGASKTLIGDMICVLLGVESPITLRSEGDHFRVLGECFVRSFQDASALLGPLPESWRVQLRIHETPRFCFVDSSSGKEVFDDPRLDPLDGWKSLNSYSEGDNPRISNNFQNLLTGEVINSDPRLKPDNLRQKGVDLRLFSLI